MAKKFVRNITNTRCKGRNQEPLETNRQNDILSDEHDVYIRNKDYYHCLTNAIQKIESKNDSIIVSKKDKNTVELEYVGGDGGGGTPGTSTPTEIISKSKYIDVKEVGTNKFELSTGQLELELEEIRKLIEGLEQGGEDDFLGDYHEYDFTPITGNVDLVEGKHYAGTVTIPTINNKLGMVRFRLPDTSNNYIRLNLDSENPINLDGPSKINVVLSFINSSNKELDLILGNTLTGGISGPKLLYKRNEQEYSNGDFKIPPSSNVEVKTTVYTDPKGKLLRMYIDI